MFALKSIEGGGVHGEEDSPRDLVSMWKGKFAIGFTSRRLRKTPTPGSQPLVCAHLGFWTWLGVPARCFFVSVHATLQSTLRMLMDVLGVALPGRGA